jgi:hypothetical protein
MNIYHLHKGAENGETQSTVTVYVLFDASVKHREDQGWTMGLGPKVAMHAGRMEKSTRACLCKRPCPEYTTTPCCVVGGPNLCGTLAAAPGSRRRKMCITQAPDKAVSILV